MAETLSARQIEERSNLLSGYWRERDNRFREWYSMIQLTDNLEQENMESFVSSDPRSAYNLLLHMLNSTRIPHRIPPELLLQTW